MEKVYKGLNSPFLVSIVGFNSTDYNMASITRCLLKYTPAASGTPEYVDSDVHTTAFDWATYAASDEIYIDLGLLDLTVGVDPYTELILFDSTFTSGRVATQIELEISDEALLDIKLADVLTVVRAERGILVKTDDYTITTTDLMLYKTFIMNAATAKTFTFPVLTSAYSGLDWKFIGIGAGTISVASGAGATIMNSTAASITGTPTENTPYPAMSLTYVHNNTTLIGTDGMGKWGV